MDAAAGDLAAPLAIVRTLDQAVPKYLDRVDRGDLIYPACKRTPADIDGNLRAIWEHTRIEAVRYVIMVPRREVELLIDPVRQPEMLDAFLRKAPHEDTVVDFTGVAIDDFVVAIVAGLNWLNHCAVLAGVDRDKFSGTQRNFRKIVVVAQQWWALEGSGPRCYQMLAQHEKPPLMLYLMWLEYTQLAKQIATAAIFGSSTDRATATTEAAARIESARDPDELPA
ncbi:MAG: hypothetical protein QOJ15_5467 [Bradyrhizobium sp.]|nr:hypothetical protein [Bradyrhizobium sp.]